MIRRLSVLLMLTVLLSSCADYDQNREVKVSWHDAMTRKLDKFSWSSREALTPYFKAADLPYAPKELAFLVFKHSKQFQIYARNDVSQNWHYIKTYPIYAASGVTGPKLHEGDHQVPEGIYHIVGLNPSSRFDLSMELDYPNKYDKREANHDHRHHLGGEIFIHGDRRSVGCIALGNRAIEQLFPLVYAVGEHHVTVVIAPNDLRKTIPLKSQEHVLWLPDLYARLQRELKQFPLV